MNTSLLSFNEGVIALERFLQQSQEEFEQLEIISGYQAIKPAKVSAYIRTQRELATSRRIHIYKSAVITLYGLLEVYIKGLVSNYIQHLNSVSPNFESLPESIKNNHTSLSLELIKLAEEDSYHGSMTSAQIIGNLFSCHFPDKNFKVNSEAFVYKIQNVRTNRITELLKKISINNYEQALIETTGFGPYYRALPVHSPNGISALFRENIDDLVTRRNEISHGVEATEILSPAILLTKAAFLKAFCNGLYEVVNNNAGEFELAYSQPKKLGKPIKVINNSIVCLNVRAVRLKVGEVFLAETELSYSPVQRGKIEEIQVDNQPCSDFYSRKQQDVAIRTNFKAKERYTYYVISKAF